MHNRRVYAPYTYVKQQVDIQLEAVHTSRSKQQYFEWCYDQLTCRNFQSRGKTTRDQPQLTNKRVNSIRFNSYVLLTRIQDRLQMSARTNVWIVRTYVRTYSYIFKYIPMHVKYSKQGKGKQDNWCLPTSSGPRLKNGKKVNPVCFARSVCLFRLTPNTFIARYTNPNLVSQ